MINVLFPAISAFDGGLATLLPLSARVFLFGMLAGAAALGIYAATSNQEVIGRLKRETRDLRRKMMDPSLEPSIFAGLVKKNLVLSLGLLGRVIGPTLLSAFPVLILATWMDVHHGYLPPETQASVSVTATPVMQIEAASQVANPSSEGTSSIYVPPPSQLNELVSIRADGAEVYQGKPFSPPIPAVGKRKWWNVVFANPGGYLSATAPMDELRFGLSAKRIWPELPSWAAGWELLFFASVFIAALAIKFTFRIQ